jgi:hypothetical protein
MTDEELVAWRNKQILIHEGQTFMGFPIDWFDNPTWLCSNGHASERYLKTERGPCCLACQGPVILGPEISEQDFQKIITGELA